MSLAPWMYVVLLGLFLIIYAQLLPKKEKMAPSGDVMKEFEQSMEMFAADIEEQNEALMELFSSTKHDYEGHLAKLSGRLEQLEKQNYQLVQELTRSRPAASSAETDSAVSAAPAVTAVAAEHSPEQAPEQAPLSEEPSASPVLMNIKERFAELFLYYGQNKSVEYIAKKLNMNKGEVQLIIQLAKQEERANV